MFESVKQGDQVHPIVYVASLLVSLAAHAVIICVLILAPLLFFSALHADELITFLFSPPTPPVPPPAPTPPPKPGAALPHTGTIVGDFVPPKDLPKGIPVPDDSAEVVNPGIVSAIPGLKGSGGGGEGISSLPGLITEVVTPPPLRAPVKNERVERVRIGELQQSKLIYKVTPVYPELARRARVSGDVILEAIIDEEGNVSTIKVLSGHALLINAAIDAVRQWKYSPTILSGEPVQVIATVTVLFRLSN